MRMTKPVSIALFVLAATLGAASALNNGYTVYLVGQEYDKPGLPTVYFPQSGLAAGQSTSGGIGFHGIGQSVAYPTPVLPVVTPTPYAPTPSPIVDQPVYVVTDLAGPPTPYPSPTSPLSSFPASTSSAPSFPTSIGSYATPAPVPVATPEPTSDPSFIVVLQNDRTTRTLKMGAEDWYESLVFKITDSEGNVYTVTRTPFDWPNRVLEDCTLSKGEKREMAVDFTLHSADGSMASWQGLPSLTEPQVVTMVVMFRGYDAAGKFVSAISKPTKVLLKPH